MKQTILSYLSAECPWRDTLHWVNETDSTNTDIRRLAADGAPHGTIVVAGMQTGGRGRMGRSFSSPAGMGMYLSVLLRPECPPTELMHLTCAAAVAACNAVQKVSGVRAGIKWTNDLVVENRKLGGILTELSLRPEDNCVEWAIIGIGINCLQKTQDFPPELQSMAVSLSTASGISVTPPQLTAAMITALERMSRELFTKKQSLLADYRAHCITLGKRIRLVQGDHILYAQASDLDEDGCLIITLDDGTIQTVHSGEVSIRGMYGYL